MDAPLLWFVRKKQKHTHIERERDSEGEGVCLFFVNLSVLINLKF